MNTNEYVPHQFVAGVDALTWREHHSFKLEVLLVDDNEVSYEEEQADDGTNIKH